MCIFFTKKSNKYYYIEKDNITKYKYKGLNTV